MGREDLFELFCVGDDALFGFEVFVEDGEGEVAEIDGGDLGADVAGALGGDLDEFLVVRAGAEAASEGEDFGGWHAGGLQSEDDTSNREDRKHPLHGSGQEGPISRKAMLLFVDESGHDHGAMPYEVLAGVAIAEDNLWNIVRAIRATEREHFGDLLRNLRSAEAKAKELLKRKRFRSAERPVEIDERDLPTLAHAALRAGEAARLEGLTASSASERELTAYSRQVIRFVDEVLNIAARHNVQVFASVVSTSAPRPERGLLRKDYVYLFERYFYYLETLPPRERGLVVFDELEKSQSHVLIQQMAQYFLGTSTGRYRSSRVVPEPFFVHSELTTGIFLADLAAYILGWGWRLSSGRMTAPARPELRGMVLKLVDMAFRGEKPGAGETDPIALHGITYIDDLRGRYDREGPSPKTGKGNGPPQG